MATITSNNSVFTITVPLVFTTPQRMQGFSVDDMFSTEPIKAAETQMGIDGILSGGFTFTEIKQSVMLEANSISNKFFDSWWAAQQTLGDVYPCDGSLSIPSIRKRWQMSNGFLSMYAPIPDGGKVLKPRKFELTWNQMLAVDF